MTENWTVFGLPRSHWHCTLENFEWEAVRPKPLQEHVLKFLTEVRAGKSPHLLLTGSPGIGKSHLGVAVYRAVAADTGTIRAMWINVPDFCERVKRGYHPDEPDPWPDVEEAQRLVVLDDLFGRDLSSHETGQIVYRLIDTAYRNNAAVLVNMNQNIEELQVRLTGHEVSRLLAQSVIIPMAGMKDFRR